MTASKISQIWILMVTLFLSAVVAFAQSGTWIKKSNAISGTWTISEKEGKKVLVLKDFKTASAPDLKIFLSPKSISEVTSENATKGSVLVAKLKAVKGDQSYSLPAGIDLSKYQSVIIHCDKYSKLWGVGKL